MDSIKEIPGKGYTTSKAMLTTTISYDLSPSFNTNEIHTTARQQTNYVYYVRTSIRSKSITINIKINMKSEPN
jgi:hypothetical protein